MRRGFGSNLASISESRSAFVQSWMFRFISRKPPTTSSMPLKMSGSPPQTEMTGAGHSTAAWRHSSTVSRALFDSYSRIFPQPMQAILQPSVGSSMITSG